MTKKSLGNFNTKRVSYVLLTKDRPLLLDKTLKRSIKLLSNRDELLVISGSETKSGIKVARKYIKYIDKFVEEKDLSAGHAANKGVLLAKGKYVKFLTDDDYVYYDAMQRAVDVMDKNEDIDVLLCGGTMYNQRAKATKTYYIPPKTKFGRSVDDAFVFGTNGMGYLIRRSSFAKTGLMPISITSDIDFMINTILSGAKIRFCRIKLYHQFVSQSTINMKYRPEINKIVFLKALKLASVKFWVRYGLNWVLTILPFLKVFFIPIIHIRKFQMGLIKSGGKKVKYVWDSGIS